MLCIFEILLNELLLLCHVQGLWLTFITFVTKANDLFEVRATIFQQWKINAQAIDRYPSYWNEPRLWKVLSYGQNWILMGILPSYAVMTWTTYVSSKFRPSLMTLLRRRTLMRLCIWLYVYMTICTVIHKYYCTFVNSKCFIFNREGSALFTAQKNGCSAHIKVFTLKILFSFSFKCGNRN